ncbi:MAG: TonB-dependent receptor [Tannerellaceae bacterium]|jgi:TonB-linked SusC/RagA family outer membrane protein|nr:TonB-dependent receptor [Tannerellaceae bacterium]
MVKVLNFFDVTHLFLNKTCAVLLVLAFSLPVLAQQQGNTRIDGRVVDERTGEPVTGASISLVKERTGTASDIDGRFTINVRSLPVTISVQFLGYKAVELDIYEYSEPIVVALREDINYLNEVVVVGYGSQKRKELTGAITTVPKAALSQPVVSVDNLLGGSVAGLNVTQGGQPGSTFSVRIRGGNSINAGNEPLFVVDGVILYGNSSTSTGVSQVSANLNPLASINPNDIESIEVLKDVSATAIYGSRGSNGVIIITTKSGQRGRGKVEYQYTIGWQQATSKLDLLSGSEWGALNKEINPEGPLAGYSDAQIAALQGYDWQDAALRTAANQNHQISFSGGDDKTRYLISGNYTNQDGILQNTNFKRYTGRLNLDREVFKNLSVGVTINASKLNQNGLNSYPSYAGVFNSPFDQIIRTSPLNPIYDANGAFAYSNIYDSSDLRRGDRTVNALSDLYNTTAQNLSNSLLGNFNVRYTIIPGLVFKLNAGTNITNTTQNYYAPYYTTGGLFSDGYAIVGNRRTDIWQYEYTLNYVKQLHKDHYIDVLAGYTTQTTAVESSAAAASNFANEQLLYHSLQSGAVRQAPTSSASEAVLNSVIGRVNYTFKNRYNLTATFRADGSSRFAANHKWGYFPSVGLSWNVNEEAFLRGNKTISDLKLRASIGTVGNQEIGNYQYEATYGTTNNYSFNNELVVGYIRNNLENPDLKWEQTVAYNVGFDLSLFKSRLNFTADAYYKKTSDLLLNLPVEISTGFSSRLLNVGSVSNKGVELEVRGIVIEGKDLNWSVSANIAENINKVIDLGGQANIGNQYFPGQPLSVNYLIEYAGIVQKGDDLSKIVGPSWKATVEPGDEKFVDQKNVDDNNKVVDNTNDRVFLGKSTPDFTYGFSTTLSYKSLSLFAAFQGVSGNKIYNTLRQSLEQPNKSYNGLAVLTDRWTETNPSTKIPKATNVSAAYNTSRFLEDGAFLRLKNVTLNYILPVKIASAPSARFSLFASAQNLFTITKFTGYDPETGGGSTAYPLSKSYSLGINLSY